MMMKIQKKENSLIFINLYILHPLASIQIDPKLEKYQNFLLSV